MDIQSTSKYMKESAIMNKLYSAVLVFIILIAITFIGYGVYLNRESGSYIAMSLAQRVVSVRGAQARFRDIRPEIVIDMVNLETMELVDAVSQVEGTLYDIRVDFGDKVKPGDLLCRVDNLLIPVYITRSEMEVAKANADYVRHRNMLERQRVLLEKKVITAGEFETAESQVAAAESELTSASASHKEMLNQQSHLDITAQAGGDVLTIYHKAGSYIGKGTPVMMIGDFSRMFFRFDLPDRQLSNLLPLDGEYEFFVDIMDDVRAFSTAYTGGYDVDVAFDLEVSNVSPAVSEPAPYRHVVCEIANDNNVLEPGIYTNAALRRREAARILAIPLSAVTEDGDGVASVYYPDEHSRLAKKNIVLGRYDRHFVEVMDGLAEGDVVLLSGGGGLALGTPVAVDAEEEGLPVPGGANTAE